MHAHLFGGAQELLLDDEILLEEAELLRLAAETATGIAYLHMPDVAIVHGDMKARRLRLGPKSTPNAELGRTCPQAVHGTRRQVRGARKLP